MQNAIVIGHGHDAPCAARKPSVAGTGEPWMRLVDEMDGEGLHRLPLRQSPRGIVELAVVDQDDFHGKMAGIGCRPLHGLERRR